MGVIQGSINQLLGMTVAGAALGDRALKETLSEEMPRTDLFIKEKAKYEAADRNAALQEAGATQDPELEDKLATEHQRSIAEQRSVRSEKGIVGKLSALKMEKNQRKSIWPVWEYEPEEVAQREYWEEQEKIQNATKDAQKKEEANLIAREKLRNNVTTALESAEYLEKLKRGEI